MTEKEILDQFAKKIIHVISKERKVIGFSWNIDYQQSTRSYWPHILDAPGFSGRVWIRYSQDFSGFASDSFQRTRTYPGSGGGGSYNGPWDSVYTHEYYARRLGLNIVRPTVECYSWDYRFHIAADKELSKIAEIIEQDSVAFALVGKGKYRLNHGFLFNEPGLAESDREFVEQVKELGGEALIKLKSERY